MFNGNKMLHEQFGVTHPEPACHNHFVHHISTEQAFLLLGLCEGLCSHELTVNQTLAKFLDSATPHRAALGCRRLG